MGYRVARLKAHRGALYVEPLRPVIASALSGFAQRSGRCRFGVWPDSLALLRQLDADDRSFKELPDHGRHADVAPFLVRALKRELAKASLEVRPDVDDEPARFVGDASRLPPVIPRGHADALGWGWRGFQQPRPGWLNRGAAGAYSAAPNGTEAAQTRGGPQARQQREPLAASPGAEACREQGSPLRGPSRGP